MSKLISDPNVLIGRYCDLVGEEEIQELGAGMDFREPKYRREVFLRFYEFHLKYRSHPGCVYFMMPWLADKFQLTQEQKYWLAFINGCTQNICTTWVIFQCFPYFEDIIEEELENWHKEYWKRLLYDTDRRYQKGHFVEMFADYKNRLNGKTQTEFFEKYLCKSENPFENFYSVWDEVFNNFFMYGRLSTYSYLEYLKIMGLNIDCPELFLEDLDGSKSHRNGIMKVCGRDDLDWHKDNPQWELKVHTKEIVDFAKIEGEKLLNEAKERFKGKDFYHDVNYFTLESTLCCYKSWHRVNRRYPNVYVDMFFQRILKSEKQGWGDHNIDFDIFWQARKECLPKHLLLEYNQNDPTFKKQDLHSDKQNHYRLTGQVIMMDEEYGCFFNDFNKKYYE